jgi:hypothetical protein
MDMTRLTTTITIPRKFGRDEEAIVPIWEAAIGHAQIAYHKAGADPRHLKYDVIAQEYPRTGHLVFIFSAMIKDEEQLVIAPFKLTGAQIGELVVSGQWSTLVMN